MKICPDIPPDLFEQLQDAAQARGMTVEQIIVECLSENYLPKDLGNGTGEVDKPATGSHA
jgi:hypothetical protein